MRVRPGTRRPPRGGSAVVEGAMTLGLYFFLLFSVLEFCRYVYLMQMAVQSARDAARLAACNVSNPDANWTGTAANNDPAYGTTRPYFTVKNVTDRVMFKLAGAHGSLSLRDGTTGTLPMIQIFPLDSSTAGLYADPPVIRPKEQATLSDARWNFARFPEKFAVRVTGNYDPIMPLLVPISGRATRIYDRIPVDIVVVMTSEG